MFYDANGNGIRDAGEQPSANQVVFIKRKDGTLIKRITTNAAGKFDFQTAAGAYPNELLYVYDSKGNLIGRFTTKKDGSGSVVCALAANPSPPSPPPPPPLPPPPLPPSTAILSGSVWLDADGNDILDAGEPTLANTDLEIRWPNGTVLKRVTLDAGGSFRVDVAKYPGQSFGLFLPDGRQIGSLATDADGNANTDVPLSNSARMGGVVFVDLNKDGVMDPTDLPVANSEIDVRFPNGTLVGRVQTDSGGRFSLIMLEQTYPGVKFVVSSSATGKVLQTFTTDQAGNSDTKIPLPPSTALIQGTAFFDNNGDSTLNAGDVPAPDTTLVIRFANGSEFVRIRTTADGEFGFPMPASPGTTFGVYTTGGQQLSTFTTDDKGNAITKVPISGPAGEIKGQVFIDMDQNGEFNPTKDALLAENRVVLRFPNGTIFQTVPIDALGRFDAVAVGKIFPNTVFGITTVSGSPVGTLRTDSSGNAAVLIPVAPATIDGDIWLVTPRSHFRTALVADVSFFLPLARTDANTNNVHDPTEAALANTFVDIKLSNGTLVARVPTNSTGGFVLSTIPYPNQQLSLFGPDGNLLKTFTTSSKGDATVTVPVHQPSSTVSGAAFVDANGNGVRDPGELPFANQSLVLRFPNGTLLATVITNTTGGFGSNVATAPNTLLVVSSPDGRILQTFKTDNAGNAQLLVAIEQKSTIQGSIFTDLNGNGVRDPSEVAFAGPYVDLAFSNNGSIIARVPVNAAGNFTFPSNSSYANTPISIFSPNGSLLQNFTADRTGGASVVVPLAPPPEIIPPGVIQGILCSDIGVDGKCDPSDPPLSNSFVTIRWPNSSVLAQVPTNSTGGYSLSIGPYPSTQFTVEGPTGSPKVPFTTDGLGNGGAMVAVAPTIPTTTSKTATPTASTLAHIQGQVFIDANSNGANDPGESSYANQPLVISWPNGTQLATVTTDLSGKFDLPTAPYPGAQFILSSQDGSFARPFTTDAQGGAVLLVPLQPVLPPTKTTTIAPTSTPGGFIQGFVCIDAAGDGMCGPGDQPLPNSLVTIRYLNGTVLAQTTTNSTGGFSVPVAVPPFQQLSVDGFGGQAPMFFQVDGAGAAVLSVARPPVLSTTKTTRPATLTATATVGRIITGFVWSDLNNDLQPGASEPRLPNYGLVIKFANGSLLTTTTTDSTGAFVIPSLGYYPSETFVVESQSGQPLATFVTDSQGSATVLVAAPAPMSSTRTDTRSMSQTPVSTPTIAGTVQGAACIDISGNGLCDPSDPPLANSFVIISWPNGTVLANLPTNATGGYSLPFVLYANQAFTISGPTGSPTVSFSTDAFGSAAPNVPIPPSAPTPTFTSSLATPTSPIPLGSIQGQVCLDANADGACQPSESAFGNSYVVVRFANGSLLATVPTNATGGYILPLPAYPFQPYTVEGPQGQPVVPFTTDVFGNARADVAISNVASTSLSIPGSRTTTASMSSVIGTTGTVKVSTTSTPLPAGQIAGLACLDIQEDGVCDSSDLPLANSTLLLKYPNGTVLAPIPTNSSGQFSYPAGLLPNQPYVLEAPSGFQVSFQTSQSGGAFVNMPIRLPGASTPTTLTSSAFSETSTTVPGATTGPATETPTSTASETSISATPTQTALAFLTGTCFFDVDKDGVFTSGIDRPIGNETVVLLFSNGSVYDYGTTMSNGTFVISGTPAPNEALTVVLASDPTAAGATITTDADGNGSANVAVLPPTILGSLFFDMDGDGSFTASDTVIGLEPLLLLFPNGSTYASVTTLADGSFTLDPALPAAANVNLTVVRASKPGVPLANFVTDSTGSGQVDVALAPPSISGQVWLGMLTPSLVTNRLADNSSMTLTRFERKFPFQHCDGKSACQPSPRAPLRQWDNVYQLGDGFNRQFFRGSSCPCSWRNLAAV